MKRRTRAAVLTAILFLLMLPVISTGFLAGFIWFGLCVGFSIFESTIQRITNLLSKKP